MSETDTRDETSEINYEWYKKQNFHQKPTPPYKPQSQSSEFITILFRSYS